MIKNIADLVDGDVTFGGFTVKRLGAAEVELWKGGFHFGTLSGEGAVIRMAE